MMLWSTSLQPASSSIDAMTIVFFIVEPITAYDSPTNYQLPITNYYSPLTGFWIHSNPRTWLRWMKNELAGAS